MFNSNEKSNEKKIYTELSLDMLKNMLNNSNYKNNNITLILKFGATWCRPCQKIKQLCNNCFTQTPDNIICFDLDIDNDNNIIFFNSLKAKKMIKGVPTIIGYKCKNNRDQWYISDISISGSNENDVIQFFKGALESLNHCNSINVEVSKGEVYKNGSKWIDVKSLLEKYGFHPEKEPHKDHMDVFFKKITK